MAERWYARLSRTFNHTFTRKPIVLYANSADFQQTTTTPEIIGEGTGGFTDPFMNRVVLPLTGDYAENDHVLGHEMVHVFQFDIAAAHHQQPAPLQPRADAAVARGRHGRVLLERPRRSADGDVDPRRRRSTTACPTCGSSTRDPHYFPYRYGQALLAYIGGRFGDDAVVRYFLAAGLIGPEAAFDRALGVPAKQLFADWQESARELYNADRGRPSRRSPARRSSAAKQGTRGNLNVGPAYSPDGKLHRLPLHARPLRHRSLPRRRADGTGHPQARIDRPQRALRRLALHRFGRQSGRADSKRLAFVTSRRATTTSASSTSTRATSRASACRASTPSRTWPGRRTTTPSPSPDRPPASPTSSSTTLESKEVRRLTNDKYADMQPAFSPDGKTIAFVTDRGSGPEANLETLYFDGTRIATIDVASGTIKNLPLFTEREAHQSAVRAGRQRSTSSPIPRAWPTSTATLRRTDRISRITRVQTGVSGITELSPALTVASRTGDIAFSLYEDDNYNIYKLPANPPSARGRDDEHGAVERARRLASAAARHRLEITAYLQQPEEGLLPANTVFTHRGYHPSLHVAYLGPPTIGVGVGSFGTGVGGSVSAYYSDILG